jgi:hypothetical protein
MVQAFPFGNISAAGHHTLIQEVLPVKSPGERHQQRLVNLIGQLGRCG